MRKSIRSYYIVTLLSILLYMPFPALSCMLRINSSFFVYLFGTECESGIVGLAAYLWAFEFFGLFITGIVLAEVKNVYFVIITISGVDLLVSLTILLFRPHISDVGWPVFVGVLLHCLHYVAVLLCTRKERIAARTKRNTT